MALLRFADLLLVGLVFGLTFAHVMELPGKLRLDGPAWLAVQQNLYVAFGPFASVGEPAAILLTLALAIMLRGRWRAFVLTLLAALSSSVGLAVWFLLVAPMNTLLNGWTTATLPPDWTACRDQWELGHAIHAALFGVAFCALLAAIVADTTRASEG